MKNYGLQVKEIPIIFRGTMKERITRERLLDVDVTCHYAGNLRSYIADIPGTIGDHDAISVEIDGTVHENIKKWEYAGQIYYGANFEGEYPSYKHYPIMVRQKAANDIEIWTEKDIKRLAIWLYDTPFEANRVLFSCDLTGNGQINHFRARFACGENGTLHLRPYVILNGNIRVDLCNFAAGGDQYIAGDNETISFDCFVPVETHAVAYVEAENVGEYPSVIDAAMTVQYEDFIESESIVGYEGVNLRRGRR